MARSGLAGSPGFGAKRNSAASRPAAAGSGSGAQRNLEFGALEAEIAELAGDAFRQRGGGSGAGFGKLLAERLDLRAAVGDLLFQARELTAARLDFLQTRARLGAEGQHGLDAPAVLALERFEKRDAGLQGGERRRVEIERIGVMLEGVRELLQLGGPSLMGGGKLLRARIDPREVAQDFADVAELAEDRVVGLGEFGERLGREVEQAAAIRGGGVAGEQALLFIGLQLGGVDFRSSGGAANRARARARPRWSRGPRAPG